MFEEVEVSPQMQNEEGELSAPIEVESEVVEEEGGVFNLQTHSHHQSVSKLIEHSDAPSADQ